MRHRWTLLRNRRAATSAEFALLLALLGAAVVIGAVALAIAISHSLESSSALLTGRWSSPVTGGGSAAGDGGSSGYSGLAPASGPPWGANNASAGGTGAAGSSDGKGDGGGSEGNGREKMSPNDDDGPEGNASDVVTTTPQD